MLPTNQLGRPVLEFCSTDFPRLTENLTVGEALEVIRAQQGNIRDKFLYFYVTDAEGKLAGVMPMRRLLTDPLDSRLSDLIIRRLVVIPDTMTLLDACEFFVLHKFLAFPVVDSARRMRGVLDVGVFTEEVLDIAEREQMDDLFQSLGIRVSAAQGATPWKAFQLRFPWLLATVGGGILCAMLAGEFASTLEEKIVLAFFMTLVLGLGESVSAQSVAVTLQVLRGTKPTWRWILRAVRREILTACLLGAAFGCIVGAVVILWHHDLAAALSIGGSILISVIFASLLGILIPAATRALRWDPRIAAGPLTLAASDICTLLGYFALAKLIFHR